MSEARAERVLREAVDRYGLDAFTRIGAGSALVADMVGGADPDLEEYSRALGAVCDARVESRFDEYDPRDLADTARTDVPKVVWAQKVWEGLLGPAEVPIAADTPMANSESSDGNLVHNVGDTVDTDHPLNLWPVLVILVLAAALIVVFVVA